MKVRPKFVIPSLTNQTSLSRAVLLTFLALITIFSPHRAFAQVDAGSLTGQVKDVSGANIPAATAELRNENTGVIATSTTDSGGSFSFSPLRIGTYTLTVTKDGFTTQKVEHITVNIQQQISLPVTLALASVTASVDVTSDVQLLQTENGSVGQVIEQKQINNLPLNGRNYFFLAQLAPGVTYGQSDTRGENSNGRFVANGLRPTQNDYLLDGIDNNSSIVSLQNGKDFVIQTPVDALSQFKVQTNSYNAEFGRAAGAVLNATVKSGTNQLHGDVWWFVRNDIFDANDTILNSSNKPRPPFSRNQFGFTLGGPVWIPKIYNGRDRTFFFVDYEGLRQSQGNTLTGTVPTALQRSSGYTNFSELIGDSTTTYTDPVTHVTYPAGTIFDPATTTASGSTYTRSPFAGNQIPSGRLDPNAVALLNLLPAPTKSGVSNNYVTSPTYRDNYNSYDIRVDQVLGKNDYIFGRYSYNFHHQDHPGIFALYQKGYADGGNSSAQSIYDDTARNFAFGYTHTFNSRLVNDLRIGVNREVVFFHQFNYAESGIPAQFGIGGIPQTENNGGLPSMNVAHLTAFGAFTFQPGQKYGTTPQVNDDVTIVRGHHSMKIGFEGQRVYSPYQQPPASRGTFTWSGLYTSVYGQTDPYTGIAQMLLSPTTTGVSPGNIAGANSVRITSSTRHHLVRNYFGAYFQDDWKATEKLTLNLGLRWDFYSPLGDQQGQVANFVPNENRAGGTYYVTPQVNKALTSAFTTALSQEGISVQQVDKNVALAQKLNFSPRVGFAYQATSKAVLRGGFGVFFGGVENIGGSPLYSGNFPVEYSITKSAANAASPIAADNSIGLLENTFVTLQATPAGTPASGVGLIGIARTVPTNYAEAYNLSVQYQLNRAMALTVGYVGSVSRHIQAFFDPNLPGQILPPGASLATNTPYNKTALSGGFFTTTGGAASYNSGQINLETRRWNGLTFLSNFAWQRSMTNARDPLEGGVGGYRAPWLPGFGIGADWQRADYDVKRVFHSSGTYELPYGRGRHFGGNANRAEQVLLGGWVLNAIATVQDGQPFSIPCKQTTALSMGCFAPLIQGQNPYANSSTTNFINLNAFSQPAIVASAGSASVLSLGSKGSQVTGPPFRRLDASLFKQFHFTERYYAELRGEVFNVTNTPNYANPTAANLNVGKSPLTATRDSPNDPREIQLAAKFYW